jgi:hypothetical protein
VTDFAHIESLSRSTTETQKAARRSQFWTIVGRVSASVIALVLIGALLLLVSLHTVPGNSDGATAILEGQSIANGNVALNGWQGGFDAFWTLDAMVNAVGVSVAGLGPILLNVVPAVIATAAVVAGALVARAGRRGPAAWAAVATVLVVLGLPSVLMATYYVQGPLHVGTALVCLLAFAALERGRFGWAWGAAIVLLAIGLLGDLLTLLLGVGPIAIAGLVAMRRTRQIRAGIAQVSAALLGIVLALAGRGLALLVGTFAISSPGVDASRHQSLRNIAIGAKTFIKLLGVHAAGVATYSAPTAFEAGGVVLVVVLIVALAASTISVVRGVARGTGAPFQVRSLVAVRERWARPELHAVAPGVETPELIGQTLAARMSWRLNDMLIFGVAGSFVVFLRLAFYNSVAFARYLVPAVIFATILAARLIASILENVDLRRYRRAVGAVGAVAIATTACLAASVGYDLATPLPGRPTASVATFLAAHNLTRGLGGYWSASITTVQTGGAIVVRPLTAAGPTRVVPYDHGDTTWFGPDQPFNFVVISTVQPFGVDVATTVATFGAPTSTYQLPNGFDVLVWAHPFTLDQTGSTWEVRPVTVTSTRGS